MRCGDRTKPVDRSTATAQLDADTRVGDQDRHRTAGLLSDAAAAGLLTLDELDQRLAGAWAASTGRQLTALETDLPTELRSARDRREAAMRTRDAARAGLAAHLTSYAAVMVLLLVVWLVGGVTQGAWYPWPIWPALGWGIGVVGHVRTARAAVH
jgi:hypothetical protein